MKRFLFSSLITCSCITATIYPAIAAEGPGHPKVTEQEKLMPCHDCHKTKTPKVYDEWMKSTHGIANVKCYQCHGTYENMVRTPDLSNCAVCHGGAFDHSEGKKCWECHPAHAFSATKQGKEEAK